ncbi:hypothetical protein [Streptomyces sp. NPDC059262]|uniref:hypothetical protein n=1 Tax=Streptomyces sp. NPDC059262 TaxID=3346797 RepID=UPI0036B09548
MHQAAPLRAVPEPLTPAQTSHLDVRRRDRLEHLGAGLVWGKLRLHHSLYQPPA